MLKLQNFKKSYDNHLILAFEELEIPDGLSWFRGVNGSGKSTFFKSIAGIVPFEGDLIDEQGQTFADNSIEFRRNISYSPAEPQYPIYLTGKEILDFYAKTRGIKGLDTLIDRFGVESFVNDKIQTYSSGMLKKVSLIAAFLGESKVLALDEPFTTIDTASQEKLAELILETLDRGVSVMIASHHEMPSLSHKVNATFMVENHTIQLKPLGE